MSTPPPKGGGRPKLFGRPDALLVDSDGPRISMPPPPPAPRAPAAPPIAVAPVAEEPVGDGPARVFIGLPGKAPQPRIATPTWDEENTDEHGKEDVASFGVAAFATTGPSFLPKGEVTNLTLGLDRSVVAAVSAARTDPPLEDGARRPGSPMLRLAPSLDTDEEDDERPAAVATRSPAPVAEVRPLWEGLPESEPAPRPVVPVRRPARSPSEPVALPGAPPAGIAVGRTPAPIRVDPEPSPSRAAPTLSRPPVARPPLPATAPAQRPAGPPPREPMPLRPPTPGTGFPPPGGRRPLPRTDPGEMRVAHDDEPRALPWALLLVGLALAAFGLWFFGWGPGRDTPAPPPAEPVSAPEPVAPPVVEPPPVVEAPAPEPPPVEEPEPPAVVGTGMVSVEADRAVVIYVDGERRGELPGLAPFELPAGEHVIRAVSGRKSRTVTVRVDERQASRVVFDFTK